VTAAAGKSRKCRAKRERKVLATFWVVRRARLKHIYHPINESAAPIMLFRSNKRGEFFLFRDNFRSHTTIEFAGVSCRVKRPKVDKWLDGNFLLCSKFKSTPKTNNCKRLICRFVRAYFQFIHKVTPDSLEFALIKKEYEAYSKTIF
jgi:hypothetical protein